MKVYGNTPFMGDTFSVYTGFDKDNKPNYQTHLFEMNAYKFHAIFGFDGRGVQMELAIKQSEAPEGSFVQG